MMCAILLRMTFTLCCTCLVDFRSLYHKLRKLTADDVEEEDHYLPLVKDFLRLSILAAIFLQIDTYLCAFFTPGLCLTNVCHTQVRSSRHQSKRPKAWPEALRAKGPVAVADPLQRRPRSDMEIL